MKYPILIIKTDESPIFFFKEGSLGLISKGSESFYDNGMVYDSDGNSYLMHGVESIMKASFLKSFKYFQQMHIVKVKLTMQKKLILSEFKALIINHINKHSKYWIKKGLIEDLEEKILTQTRFADVIYLIE